MPRMCRGVKMDCIVNRLLLSIGVLATLSSMALADNGPVSTRGQCYDLVISSCNANSQHPTSCATNGMNQCDEQFPAPFRPDTGRPMTLIMPEGQGDPGRDAGRGAVGLSRN